MCRYEWSPSFLCVESKLNKADLRVRKHDIACCTYHHHHHTCEKRVRHEPNQPSILVRQAHLPVSTECAVTYVPKTWKTVDKSKEASPPTSVSRHMYPNGLSFGFTKCEERERERLAMGSSTTDVWLHNVNTPRLPRLDGSGVTTFESLVLFPCPVVVVGINDAAAGGVVGVVDAADEPTLVSSKAFSNVSSPSVRKSLHAPRRNALDASPSVDRVRAEASVGGMTKRASTGQEQTTRAGGQGHCQHE